MNGLDKIVSQNIAAAAAGVPDAPTLGVESLVSVQRINERTGAIVTVQEPVASLKGKRVRVMRLKQGDRFYSVGAEGVVTEVTSSVYPGNNALIYVHFDRGVFNPDVNGTWCVPTSEIMVLD